METLGNWILLIHSDPLLARRLRGAFCKRRGERFEFDYHERLDMAEESIRQGCYQAALIGADRLRDELSHDATRVARLASAVAVIVVDEKYDERLGNVLVEAGAQEYFTEAELFRPTAARRLRIAIARHRRVTPLADRVQQLTAAFQIAQAIMRQLAKGKVSGLGDISSLSTVGD